MTEYHVVHFHADGGVACFLGQRVFPDDPVGAESFAKMMREEKGHTCKDSVWTEVLDHDPGNVGKTFVEGQREFETCMREIERRPPPNTFQRRMRALLERVGMV